MTTQWRQFYTLVYSNNDRDAVTIPIPISAEFVRVKITILTHSKPKWYRAGWINQAVNIAGALHLKPGFAVPLVPSVFTFDNSQPYQIRFKPVPYMPPSIVTFYRSI